MKIVKNTKEGVEIIFISNEDLSYLNSGNISILSGDDGLITLITKEEGDLNEIIERIDLKKVKEIVMNMKLCGLSH